MAETKTKYPVSSRLYDGLKFVAQILLPALGTLYFTLSEIWHLPFGKEVVGSITAFDLFLGVLLSALSRRYYNSGANFDGDVNVYPEDGGNKVQFSFNEDPADIVDEPGKHSVEMRIKRLGGGS